MPALACRHAEGEQSGGADVAEGEQEEEEEEQAFSPERGNVAFGSAYDGWAFRIDQFAGGRPTWHAAACSAPAACLTYGTSGMLAALFLCSQTPPVFLSGCSWPSMTFTRCHAAFKRGQAAAF